MRSLWAIIKSDSPSRSITQLLLVMSSTVVGIGSNQLWAFTPAIDLLELFPPPPPKPVAAQPAQPAVAAQPTAAAAVPSASSSSSSSGKTGASSALARLLLAAGAPASNASAAAATAAASSGSGALSLLLVDTGDVLSALKTLVLSHRHRAAGATTDTPIEVQPDATTTPSLGSGGTRELRELWLIAAVWVGLCALLLQLYLLDDESSSTARHLLLLSIAFDTALSLRGRTELFLEVYGNSLIQEKTQLYINRRVKDIRK